MVVPSHRRDYSEFDGSDYVLRSNGFYNSVLLYGDWIQTVFMGFKYVRFYQCLFYIFMIPNTNKKQ